MKTRKHKQARETALAAFHDDWELLDRHAKRRAREAFDRMIIAYLGALKARICLSEAVGFMYPQDIARLQAGRIAQIFAGKERDSRFIPVFSGDPAFIDTDD
ncbi:hypothetical protein [Rhizobium sp. IMFF44]|uniref:hypothetical protein n=1 Tax=Rhizobium sp. IMFF44 TaxID=3342350 RepID=UPI0035BC471C